MEFSDAFVNCVSGLGTLRDKSHHGRFQFKMATSRDQLDAAYRSNWIAGTIVDAPADDMTREWRTWHVGPRQQKSIKHAEKTLRIPSTTNRAMKMARLYGGSALLIGDGSPDPSKPLYPESVKKGGLKYVHALSKWEIWAGTLIRDPTSEWFGEPEYYMLAVPEKENINIHPSRVVRFQGIPWLEMTYTMDGWGFSVLERAIEAARDVAASTGNLASMTYEGKLDVIKIKGLTENVNDAAYRNRLLARFSVANLNKSVNNALILDGEEDWQQKTINLSNMPEGIRTLLEVAAGAANMPVTRLLGTSPKGLNATGQGELRNYYDMLAGKQETDISPAMDRLDQVLVRHAIGSYPEDCHSTWNPLWQMTEAEEATIGMQRAQRDQIYATTGAMAPSAMRQAITNGLLRDRTYPGLQDALDKFAGEAPAPLIVKKEAMGNEINTPSSTARVAKTDAARATKKSAEYTPDGTEREHCSLCKHFLGDGACERVAGRVVPDGWCRFFQKGHHIQDAAPRTLNVSRPVENAAELLRWAQKQGIPNLMRADQLHVTIAYSHEPVDWFRAYGDSDQIEVPAGGPRLVEPLGGEGAVVLLFANERLSWRWDHFRDIGASWPHGDEFQPHITLSWDIGDFDLSKVTPYGGRIVLGPEKFAEIDNNWRAKVGRS